jgi:thiopeptide-type bacteriocin biosynthesis protein
MVQPELRDCPGLARVDPGGGWLQYDVALGAAPRPEHYAALLTLVRELSAAGTVDEFFFMHKPPGLRIRFRPAGQARAACDAAVSERLSRWQDGGLVARWRPAVYEPEVHLFGGPVSMRSVHSLFTADSLLWLTYHASPVLPGGADAGPSWNLSLVMLRGLFDSVRISGWEDLDVWDRVRWQTGRRLAPEVAGALGLEQLSDALQGAWAAAAGPPDGHPPHLRDAIVEYRQAVAAEGERWLADYFHSGAAILGPRAAVAYVVIFHWNRAGLSGNRQALLTEGLVAHPAREALVAHPAREALVAHPARERGAAPVAAAVGDGR